MCLAGGAHEPARNDAIHAIQSCEHNHYIILLKQTTMLKYSAVYLCDLHEGILVKITGDGPDVITSKQISQCYKYDSAGKQWSLLPSNKLTLTTDAITYNVKHFLNNGDNITG